MHSHRSNTLILALGGVALVAAHGHIANFVINGVDYPGFDPTKDPYKKDPPTVVGWTTDAKDNGFVASGDMGSPDIICHKAAKNAKASAEIAAGDNVFLPWDTWPESHKGPVVDYLAPCGDGGCEAVDKSTLKFFKIDEVGRVDNSSNPGTWGSDQLIKNGNGWMVQIPKAIAPGDYVLRHEMIALHQTGDPQMYPQCVNLKVTGGGTDKPEGVLATELYKKSDPGMAFNIYNGKEDYKIPGPALYSGAVILTQSKSQATTTTSFGGAASSTSASPTTTTTSGGASSPTAAAAASDGADGADDVTPDGNFVDARRRRHARAFQTDGW